MIAAFRRSFWVWWRGAAAWSLVFLLWTVLPGSLNAENVLGLYGLKEHLVWLALPPSVGYILLLVFSKHLQ